MGDIADDTADIGGVKVPKQFADRWKQLIETNRGLKAKLTETEAALATAQEEVATGSNAELEKAKARIGELETELSASAWTTALAEDGLSEDAETLDYLQYQYGKFTPEDGAEKPSVKEWYQTFREKSTVVTAAKKTALANKGKVKETPEPGTEPAPKAPTGAGAGTTPAKPVVGKDGKPVAVAPKVAPKVVVTPKPIPADAGGLTAESITKLDPKGFENNRAGLRKQLFGS